MITQQTVDKFIRNLSDQMVSYVRGKYDCPTFNPIVQVTFAANRKASRGGVRNGKAFFNIVANRFLAAAQGTGMMDEPEYKSFNRDPVIGGLYNVTWQKALASLVAHELAHSIQFDQGTKVGAKRVLGIEELDDRNEILRGHDWFWKRIYGDLRTQFVNNNQFEIEKPVEKAPAPKPAAPAPKPAAPAPKVVKPEEITPAAPRTGTLYVKYTYKGNTTVARFYIDQKLAAVIVEVNRQFFKADAFGDVQEKLPFTTLAEARRFLIGM
jgi:hypothetical protein